MQSKLKLTRSKWFLIVWRRVLRREHTSKYRIPDAVVKQIAKVHNSMVGHWGLQKCRERLNDPTITDRSITLFIRQCPCCQVMSWLKILYRTHPFTCASYNPFESLHIDHIGPLPVDDKGNKTTGAAEAALRSIRNTRRHTHWSETSLPQRTLLRVLTVVVGQTFLRHSVLERGERSRRAC